MILRVGQEKSFLLRGWENVGKGRKRRNGKIGIKTGKISYTILQLE